jgi:predicted site-specific integrase-resolvase
MHVRCRPVFDDLTEDTALPEILRYKQHCAYCTARGWKVVNVVKEVGSGVNDGRKKLLALLADPTVTVIVVEHKDRLTNQKRATTIFPLLSAQSFERENAVTFKHVR